MIEPNDLARAFESAFGRPPRIYRAPGRVNLIGEHTDYNDGFVMPMALDRSTCVAAAPRSDRHIVVRSQEYNETATIDLDAPRTGPTGLWTDSNEGLKETIQQRYEANTGLRPDVWLCTVGDGVAAITDWQDTEENISHAGGSLS